MSVSERYILSHPAFGAKVVTRNEYIAAERAAGFRPLSGNDDEVYAESFESGGISGRVETITDPDLSELVLSIEKLELVAGNMVIVRTPEGIPPDSISQLVVSLKPHFPEGCPVAVLQGNADIKQLTDESMREQGWVRTEVPIWSELLALSELPNVHEAIENLIDSGSEDNAVCLVRAILTAFLKPPAAEGNEA